MPKKGRKIHVSSILIANLGQSYGNQDFLCHHKFASTHSAYSAISLMTPMCANLFSTPFLEIAYSTDLDLLMGRWLCTVAEAEMHASYDALRQAALHYTYGNWLIDARRRVCRYLHRTEWVTRHYLPQMQQALGEPLCVGLLVLPDYLASLPQAYAYCVPTAAVQFASFVDEGAANSWLATEPVAS